MQEQPTQTVFVLTVVYIDHVLDGPEPPRVFAHRGALERYVEKRGLWGNHAQLAWEGVEDGEEISAHADEVRVRA